MTTAAIKLDEHQSSDPGKLWLRLAALHDHLFAEQNTAKLKQVVIRLGIAGFVIHLLLIFLARTLPHPPALIANVGLNYLVAISTPFNFILFYEVTTMIGALHESTTRSVAYQFEIVSLIFIRDVFKDIADATAMVTEHRMTWEALPLLVNMWAGLIMYLLVAIFQHVSRHHAAHIAPVTNQRARSRFVAQKKAVAILLGSLLVIMAAYSIGVFLTDVYQVAATGQLTMGHVPTFYNNLFTVMIFTDVLMLILSIGVSGHYESVFRSAAFVVSIVLIRFALTEGYPYGAPLAILAMVFGIVVQLVFNFHMRVHAASAD